VTNLVAVIIEEYHCYELRTFHPAFFLEVLKDNFEDNQSGFLRNGSTTDQIFYICQILVKKWACIWKVYQLFIDFKKSSVRREIFYIVIESCTP
jgi:hypothetical protein